MSAGERAFGLLKSVMLMTERFDAIDAKIRTIASDQASLARHQSELAQRIAGIEGYLRAATGTPFAEAPRLENK